VNADEPHERDDMLVADDRRAARSCLDRRSDRQTPKFTYFDSRGLGEISRLLLAAADVVYTDVRIPMVRHADGTLGGDEWGAHKADTPYGQSPVFELEGVKIAQSNTITRFIARKYHLDGDDEVENALLDAAFESCHEIRMIPFVNNTPADKLAKFWSTGLSESLGHVNKNIVGSGSAPWFMGKRMTYVDVSIYYTVWFLARENEEATSAALAAHPKIQAIYYAVEQEPKIAKYLATRKVTPL
jgi:glutathione S-transferase